MCSLKFAIQLESKKNLTTDEEVIKAVWIANTI